MILVNNNNLFSHKKKYTFIKIISFLGLILFISIVWILFIVMENQPPKIKNIANTIIGKYHTFPINITDSGCGLKQITVNLVQKDREIKLVEKKIYISRFWNHKKCKDINFQLKISVKDLSLSDGPATLNIIALDSSIRNFGKGNESHLKVELEIDTSPPKINVINSSKNINVGGTGIVLYKISKPCLNSGIIVGDKFFRGYPNSKDNLLHLAFFAIEYDQDIDTKIFMLATDYAGNNSKAGLKYQIFNKSFNKDKIVLSNQFLNWKMPEFSDSIKHKSNTNWIDLFLKVNNEIRELNGKKLNELCSKSEDKIMWEGPFLRLPGSVNKANFGDDRSYIYKEEIIDQQVHLGIDLASIARSSIPSANSGKVIFSDNLGIYGNTVIIDHGLGLFSLYSHLSQTYVQKNEIINKGHIIGQTGKTGLAGGDHLHFAMRIGNAYINPTEWWDKSWVKNNITSIIEYGNFAIE